MQDVPKIVRQQLKASTPTPASMPATAGLHLDADLLTAFAERALAGAERASVVEHLAHCGDCRDVVALALPASETVAVPATPGARIGWLSLPVLRWGVVAAGLLAVASVGVQQYKLHHQEQIVASNVIQSKETTDAATQKLQALQQAPAPVDPKPLGPEQMRKEATATLPAQARGTGSIAIQAQRAFAPSSSEVVEVQSEAAQVTAQTTAQNQVQDQLIQNQKELPLNGRNVINVDTVAKAKDPVPGTASVSPVAAADIPPQTAAIVGTSPRWAISPAGALQRSLDDGRTWQDTNPAAAYVATASAKKVKASPDSVPVFRAVAAAGLEIWAGGSAGALYHTVDGGSGWTLVQPSAAGAILTGDITSIQFPDSQHGTVATSTAEIWITADDGQTWRKQQ
jgi:hypothetical protein